MGVYIIYSSFCYLFSQLKVSSCLNNEKILQKILTSTAIILLLNRDSIELLLCNYSLLNTGVTKIVKNGPLLPGMPIYWERKTVNHNVSM